MTITEKQDAPAKPERVKHEYEFKALIPKGFHGDVQGPVDVLLRAQTVLLNEERWVKQTWFQNRHPELDPDDPFCNNWQACAAGAVALVSIGAARMTAEPYNEWDDESPWECTIVRREVPKDKQQWSLLIHEDESSYETPPNLGLYNQTLDFLLQGAREVHDGKYYSNVPEFNDFSMTSREDVIRAFSNAIALASKAEAKQAVAASVSRHLEGMIA